MTSSLTKDEVEAYKWNCKRRSLDELSSRLTQNELEAYKRKGKKRTADEMTSSLTEEEVEAYKRSKVQVDDPMLKFAGSDDLIR